MRSVHQKKREVVEMEMQIIGASFTFAKRSALWVLLEFLAKQGITPAKMKNDELAAKALISFSGGLILNVTDSVALDQMERPTSAIGIAAEDPYEAATEFVHALMLEGIDARIQTDFEPNNSTGLIAVHCEQFGDGVTGGEFVILFAPFVQFGHQAFDAQIFKEALANVEPWGDSNSDDKEEE